MLEPNIKILSIDPGITNLGWACSEYVPVTSEFHVRQYGLVKASKEAKKIKEFRDLVEGQVLGLSVLEGAMTTIIDDFLPHFVVSEDCFINIRCPSAHASLATCLYSISRILFTRWSEGNLATNPRLFKIAPRSIKLAISGYGGSDKLNILDAVLTNDKIKFPIPDPILSEHECDAIACGYVFASTLLHLQPKHKNENPEQ